MSTDQVLPFSVVSVVEDVLQQQTLRSSDFKFASRKAEEACIYPFSLLLLFSFKIFIFHFHHIYDHYVMNSSFCETQ